MSVELKPEYTNNVLISKKLKTNAKDFTFSSMADFLAEYEGNPNFPTDFNICFLDSKTTLGSDQFYELINAASIRGNEPGEKAQNTLTVQDVAVNVVGENGTVVSGTVTNTKLGDFLNVNVVDSSLKGVDVVKKNQVKVSQKKEDVTKTYTIDGSVKLSGDSRVANIVNYKSVTLTNSHAGNITLENLSKEYYEVNPAGEVVNDDDNRSVYTAAGALTVKADKNATEANYTVGSIKGYLNVTLTGYVDKKNPDNNATIKAGSISGGNKTEWWNRVEKEETGEDGKTPDAVAGTLKMTNAETSGSVEGFNTVSVTDGTINGEVLAAENKTHGFGLVYCGSVTEDLDVDDETGETESYKLTTKSAGNFTLTRGEVTQGISGYKSVTVTDDSTVGGVIDFGKIITVNYKKAYGKTTTQTLSYKTTANGSVTLKNAKVQSDIKGYNTVKATNSTISGAVSNKVITYSATVKFNADGITSDTGKYEEKASGSFTMTVDKNGTEEDGIYEVGAVTGFDKVTLTGYSGTQKVDGIVTPVENGITVYGDIRGGKLTVTGKTGGKSVETGIIFGGEHTAVYAATGSVTLSKGVTVGNNGNPGDIVGFSKVTASQSEITGHITSTPADDFKYSASNKAQGASVTLTDSKVSGEVTYYTTVKLTNSSVSGAVENLFAFTTKKGVAEEKAAGSFTMTVNKNAENSSYSVRNVIGYDKVSITGYTGTQKVDGVVTSVEKKITVNGDIRGGKLTAKEESETYSATGSVTLSKGVTVNGDIKGYSKVTASQSTITGSITSTPESDDFNSEYSASNKAQGASVTLTDSEVSGDVTYYTTVKLTNSSVNGGVENLPVSTTKKGVTETKTVGSFTMTVNKNATGNVYKVGSVADYDKVTISGYSGTQKVDGVVTPVNKRVMVGGIVGGKVKTVEETHEVTYLTSGSVSLKNVLVNGSISGYDKVTVAAGAVQGDIVSSNDLLAVGTSVTLTDTQMLGNVGGYKSFTASGSEVVLQAFTGTEAADTFKVSKNTTVNINTIDLGEDAKDKLVVDGTLYVYDLVGIDTVSGKGTIYTTAALGEELVALGFKGEIKEFNFAGLDDGDTAVTWDGSEAVSGKLIAGIDDVDYIKFTVGEDETKTLDLSGLENVDVSLTKGGETFAGTTLEAGEYLLTISRTSTGLQEYTVAFAS